MDFKFVMLDDENAGGFALGDIVSLVSGGPDMTVISVFESGCYEVAWFDGDGLGIECFPGEALDYV